MCVHGLIQRREFFTLVLSLVIVHRLLAIVHICHCFVCTIYNTCHACTKCKKALTMLYNLYLWANSARVLHFYAFISIAFDGLLYLDSVVHFVLQMR